MKLSKTQERVLVRMIPAIRYTAHDLKASLATLDALVSKGELKSEHGLGSGFNPRTGIKYWKPGE